MGSFKWHDAAVCGVWQHHFVKSFDFLPYIWNLSFIVLQPNENCKLFCWLIYFRPTIAAVTRFRLKLTSHTCRKRQSDIEADTQYNITKDTMLKLRLLPLQQPFPFPCADLNNLGEKNSWRFIYAISHRWQHEFSIRTFTKKKKERMKFNKTNQTICLCKYISIIRMRHVCMRFFVSIILSFFR